MEEIKLIKILKTLSDEEYRKLQSFAASPYHTEGKNYKSLFTALKKFHPGYDSSKLTSENLYKALYPGKKYNEGQVRNLFHRGTKIAMDFLHVERYLKNKPEVKFNLIEELAERNIDNLFNSETKKISAGIDDDKELSIYKISDEIKFLDISLKQFEKKGQYYTTQDIIFKSADLVLIKSLITLMMKVQDIISFRNTIVLKQGKTLSEEVFENINLEKLEELISKSKPKGYELLLFYYYRLKFYYSGGDYLFFEKTKQIAFESLDRYDYEEAYHITNNLCNCCLWQIKSGNDTYAKELFEIYKFRINSGYILRHNSYITLIQFRNIFNNGLHLGEVEWVEQFLNSYSRKLASEYSEDIASIGYAQLYLAKKEYDKSINMLIKTEYKNYLYKLDGQTLLMMNYYETGSVENLLSLSESFMHFLIKNKEKNPKIIGFFIKFVTAIVKLQKLRIKPDLQRFYKLKNNILKGGVMIEKKWVLEKLDEFEKSVNR